MREKYLLTLAALLASGSLLFSRCAPAPEAPVDSVPPEPQAKAKSLDPILRASGIRLSFSNGYGAGSLVENEGKLYIYSALHVAEMSRRRPFDVTIQSATESSSTGFFHTASNLKDAVQPNNLKISFASILSSTKLQFLTMTSPMDDVPIRYGLDGDLALYMRGLIDKEKITPLEEGKVNLSKGDEVAIAVPNTEFFTRLRYEKTDVRGWLVLRHVSGEVICQGRSGGPVIELVDGVPTNRIVGIVSKVVGDFRVSDPAGGNRICSTLTLAMPINQLLKERLDGNMQAEIWD